MREGNVNEDKCVSKWQLVGYWGVVRWPGGNDTNLVLCQNIHFYVVWRHQHRARFTDTKVSENSFPRALVISAPTPRVV